MVILHVIDDIEPLSIANAIEKESRISPVFPQAITLKMDLQGENLLLCLISEFSLHNSGILVAFGGKIVLPLSDVPKWHKAAASRHPKSVFKGPEQGIRHSKVLNISHVEDQINQNYSTALEETFAK